MPVRTIVTTLDPEAPRRARSLQQLGVFEHFAAQDQALVAGALDGDNLVLTKANGSTETVEEVKTPPFDGELTADTLVFADGGSLSYSSLIGFILDDPDGGRLIAGRVNAAELLTSGGKLVSPGAPNSGGFGNRMLTIPNA